MHACEPSVYHTTHIFLRIHTLEAQNETHYTDVHVRMGHTVTLHRCIRQNAAHYIDVYVGMGYIA